ncbi:Peptidase M8 [Trypanosoma melophagium]|uniref:Peptidase M8 n=1 Tax=Trypanosoma melophagium TaxID=715481 RepID=UPI00351A3548|nr:Peptidase M8 [Trypanosoma melophagium]
MRHLLFPLLLLVLLFCCVGTSFAAILQPLPQKGESVWHACTAANTDKYGENWKPIRITVSAEDVDTELSRCKRKWVWAERNGVSYSWKKEDKALCDKVNGITDAKKELLLNKLLPAAIKLHTDRLSIQRKEGKVMVSASTVNSFSTECSVTITGKPKTEGFPDADFNR